MKAMNCSLSVSVFCGISPLIADQGQQKGSSLEPGLVAEGHPERGSRRVGTECTEEVPKIVEACMQTDVSLRPSAKDLVGLLQACATPSPGSCSWGCQACEDAPAGPLYTLFHAACGVSL